MTHPATPSVLPVEESGIPNGLKHRRCWAVWQLVYDSQRSNWTKPPYKPIDDGYSPYASPSNSHHRWPLDECLTVVHKGGADGIGIMVGDSVVAIDLDDCFEPSGVIKLWAYELTGGFNTYTERSPSGTGLHLVAFCDMPLPNRDRNLPDGGKIQFFGSHHFCTITGHVDQRWSKKAFDVQDCTPALYFWHSQTWTAPIAPVEKVFFSTEGGVNDDDLLRRMFTSRQGDKILWLWEGDTGGYGSHSEGDMALMSYLAFWCNRDAVQMQRLFEESGLHRPGEKAASYLPDLVQKAIARTSSGYRPSQIDPAAVAAAQEAAREAANS